MNESEEYNVTAKSRNTGIKLIAVSLILIDLGKCSAVNPFRAKSMASVCHHSFAVCCGTFMSLQLKCTVLLIVCTISDGLSVQFVDMCVICIHLMRNWILFYDI